MNVYLISIIAMGGLGIFFAGVLAYASTKLQVKEDPKVAQILEALPGLNCAACGFAGCHEFAEKVAAKGSLENLSCPPGGAEVHERIAEILGIAAGSQVRKWAVVMCGGGKGSAVDRAEYRGVRTCAAAELVAGGHKGCTYGCLGLADCVRVCPFDAIYMGEDDLPHVIEEKCTACGLCVEACPRDIIELVPCSNRVVVNCNSKDKGAVVRQVCKVGCIACMICIKIAPESYKVDDNLAKVIYEKGDAIAEPAIEKCPTKCIVKL